VLQSALARAKQLAAYDESADCLDMATAYTAGIVKNHRFVDGDKRTGFVAGVLFLELNGFRFAATESAAADAVLTLAAGDCPELLRPIYSMRLRRKVAAWDDDFLASLIAA
jgi:death-on-curing protein